MKTLHGYLCVAIVLGTTSIAMATPQALDRLRFGGHEYAIFEVPMLGLWHYGVEDPPKGKLRPPVFDVTSTANNSGYDATWEIRGSQLFLHSIRGRIKGKKVKNEAILANQKFPLVATWFSGKIHLPVGDLIEEKGEYEAVIVFEIDKGIVKSMTFLPSARISGTWDGL